MKIRTSGTVAGIILLLASASHVGTAQTSDADQPSSSHVTVAAPSQSAVPLAPAGDSACCDQAWGVYPNGQLWANYCTACAQGTCKVHGHQVVGVQRAAPPLHEFAIDRFVLAVGDLFAPRAHYHQCTDCADGGLSANEPQPVPANTKPKPANTKPKVKNTKPKPKNTKPSVKNTKPKVTRSEPAVRPTLPSPNPPANGLPNSGVESPSPVLINTPSSRSVPIQHRLREPIVLEPALDEIVPPAQNSSPSAAPRDEAPRPPQQLLPAGQRVPTNVIPKRFQSTPAKPSRDASVSQRIGDYISTR